MYDFSRRDHCPVCGEKPIDLISFSYGQEPLFGYVAFRYGRDASVIDHAQYTISRCPNCTLFFQREVGGNEFLTHFYTDWVKKPRNPTDMPTYRRDIQNILASRDAHEILTAAAFLGRNPRDLKTLDYGMGWALWARIARELGCESWGYELSLPMVSFAENHGVKIASLDSTKEGGFHFINCEQVLEHLSDPKAVTVKLAELLEPGGILKASVPSLDSFEYRKIGRWLADRKAKCVGPLDPLRHINGFTSQAVETLAGEIGLRVIRPSLAERYEFLRTARTLTFWDPKHTIKELARPIVQYHRRSNLYVWLEKPKAATPP